MNPELYLDIIGITGAVFLLIAYYPQLYKIIKTKKAKDLSLQTWIIISIGHLLLLTYGIIQRNIFIAMLFTAFSVENIAVILLIHKYGAKDPVPTHPAPEPTNPTSPHPHSKDTL